MKICEGRKDRKKEMHLTEQAYSFLLFIFVIYETSDLLYVLRVEFFKVIKERTMAAMVALCSGLGRRKLTHFIAAAVCLTNSGLMQCCGGEVVHNINR